MIKSFDFNVLFEYATRGYDGKHHVYHRFVDGPCGCVHAKHPNGCRDIVHICSCGAYTVETRCGNDFISAYNLQKFLGHFPPGQCPQRELYEFPLENEYLLVPSGERVSMSSL